MAATTTTNTTTSHDKVTALSSFLSPLTTILSEDILYRLAHNFSATYAHLAACSTEHFFPTPITHLPTGKEQGRYLAVYVGLFYLHVGFIELLGHDHDHHKHDQGAERSRGGNGYEFGSEYGYGYENNGNEYDEHGRRMFPVRRTLEKAWPISEQLKREHPVEFFAWIGSCIAEVVGDMMRRDEHAQCHYKQDETRELVAGISFCFPIMYVYTLSFFSLRCVLLTCVCVCVQAEISRRSCPLTNR